MKKLTVILPAAGKGTRLNLPYPKEIFRIDKEKALIDNSFELFSQQGRDSVEFVVVVNEHKTEIVKYLSKYKSKFNVSFTYQNPEEVEYTGAIKSAAHLFGERNIVLLPDTLLTLAKGVSLIEEVHHSLDKAEFTFLFKPEKKEDILKTKGCLRLGTDGRVLSYEDKPSNNLSNYDGYWCAFAFKKAVFDECIAFMEQSTLKFESYKTNIEQTKIFNSQTIEVETYKDLGTWEEVRDLLSKDQ